MLTHVLLGVVLLIHCSGRCALHGRVWTAALPRSPLSQPSALRGRSFHTLCSDKTMCEKVRPRWKSTAPSHKADQRGNEHITSSFLFSHLYLYSSASPPPPPFPPSLFLSHSITPGIELIIPKVTHGLPPSLPPSLSLTPPFSSSPSPSMRKTSPREFQSGSPTAGNSGSQTSVSSSHREFLPHHFLVPWDAFSSIHEGEKVTRIIPQPRNVSQRVTH